MGRVQATMLRMIEWYQSMFAGRPSPCRFFPTCSEYGHEAIRLHGAGRGLWLTTRRLARCRPFGKSGFDPVPEPTRPALDHSAPDHQAAVDPVAQEVVAEEVVLEKTA